MKEQGIVIPAARRRYALAFDKRSAATEKAYLHAVNYYRDTCKLRLPATEFDVLHYISMMAGKYTVATISLRITALATWHRDFSFPDPTSSHRITTALRELKRLAKSSDRVTTPLDVKMLKRLVSHQEESLQRALGADDHPNVLRALRNRALLLLGFWRGMQSRDMRQLRVEHIDIQNGKGVTIYEQNQNREKITFIPCTEDMCLVTAIQEWLVASQIKQGPLFVQIDRWGRLSLEPLSSISTLLKSMAKEAGITERLTTRSFRLGMSEWAKDNDWKYRDIIEYFGLSALRAHESYIP
ncbi:tyrosine-type recombinase/integrase [Pseudomonas sp. PDM33]|uniref:tyrosine-type recombinase/integrase n=1 Tax=unclassified Pseudomonas TaxID=196821 RepID=UPI0009E26213|nr:MULTISPECIES: tyrosine-type recombinase/integrase [unclassified Pseudomonas]MBV7586281.1 tyrosine-type recombinase/integrase [Pseudomonas sp. PDM33]